MVSRSPSRRALFAALLVLFLAGVYGLLRPALERDDELWDYPELGPDFGAEGAAELGGGARRRLELRIEPLGVVGPSAFAGSALTLRSRAGGRPVPMRLRIGDGLGEERELEVAGDARIRGLRPGAWLAVAEGPGGRSAHRVVAVPDGGAGGTLAFAWTVSASFAGRVFGPDGLPLAGARVSIGECSVRSGVGGRFRIDGLVPGPRLPVLVRAPGMASQLELCDLPAGGRTGHRFVLTEGGTLSGACQLPTAELAEARLVVVPARVPRGRPPSWPYLPVAGARIRLDSRGHFRVPGLPLGVPLRLAFLHPRYVQDEPLRFELDRPARAPRGVLVLPRRLPVLRGVCSREADATPLAGLRITTRPASRGAARWGAALRGLAALLPAGVRAAGSTVARSDAEGRYAIGLPFARTWVEAGAALASAEGGASTEGGTVGEAVVLRARAGLRHDFRLALVRAGARAGAPKLRCRFVGATGRGLSLRIRWAGRIRRRPFPWDPRRSYELSLVAKALLRLSCVDLETGALLYSERLRVLADTPVTIRLP